MDVDITSAAARSSFGRLHVAALEAGEILAAQREGLGPNADTILAGRIEATMRGVMTHIEMNNPPFVTMGGSLPLMIADFASLVERLGVRIPQHGEVIEDAASPSM